MHDAHNISKERNVSQVDKSSAADISYFTNDKFRILFFLYKNRNSENHVRITQQEVADALGISRVTMNGYFKQLREDGFIEQDSARLSKYILTDKTIESMKMFNLPKK